MLDLPGNQYLLLNKEYFGPPEAEVFHGDDLLGLEFPRLIRGTYPVMTGQTRGSSGQDTFVKPGVGGVPVTSPRRYLQKNQRQLKD